MIHDTYTSTYTYMYLYLCLYFYLYVYKYFCHTCVVIIRILTALLLF